MKNALAAGFDAVELHLTNGYFFASFISGRTNRRTDSYGGTFEGRMKLPLEIISMIKREIGPDYPLLARVSVNEVNRGRGLEESRLVACALADAGIDIMDFNIGSMCEYSLEFPPYTYEQGFSLSEMEELRRSLDIPVIAGGRVTEPVMAEQILKDNRADLVYVNRQHLADPEWVKKAASKQTRLIRRCIGCTRCIASLRTGSVVCSVNPFVGHEAEWKLTRSTQPKNIVVVGGGPAGLQAASAAAQQGHNVTLLEKSDTLGGNARAAAMPPMKWEISGLISTLAYECELYGVKVCLNSEACRQSISALKPDRVILTTGALPVIVPIPGAENLIPAIELLEGRAWVGQKVAIVGGGMIGLDTADFLTDYNRDITIFEMRAEAGMDMWLAPKLEVLRHLKQSNVVINTSCEVIAIDNGRLTYRKDGGQVSEKFDSVVLAAGMVSYNPLEKELKNAGMTVTLIGDALSPTRFQEALVSALEAVLNDE